MSAHLKFSLGLLPFLRVGCYQPVGAILEAWRALNGFNSSNGLTVCSPVLHLELYALNFCDTVTGVFKNTT